MNAVWGILRAAFRLKGSLVWWSFYISLTAVALAMLAFKRSDQVTMAALMIGSMGAWMGWCLFLPRLWQLQRHAESLQLPAATASHARALLTLGALGCLVPAALMSAFGAPAGLALLFQVSSLASAMLYLLLTPLSGALLLAGLFGVGWLLDRWLPIGSITEAQWIGLLGGTSIAAFAASGRLWRRTMRQGGAAGWSTPQISAMAQDLAQPIEDPAGDPAAHWVSTSGSRVDASVGPRRPVRSLALLLCGPLAPQGLGTYLVNAIWMVTPVLFLAVMALVFKPESKGPVAALVVLIGAWSLGVPLTLLTRLRREWREGGQALSEAALLPALHRDDRSWSHAVLAVLATAIYRLWLPSLLTLGVLVLKRDVVDGAAGVWLTAWWGCLMMVLLLPVAQRQSVLGGAAYYVLCLLVVLGVIHGDSHFLRHGGLVPPLLIGIITGLVMFAAWVAMSWPQRSGPYRTG